MKQSDTTNRKIKPDPLSSPYEREPIPFWQNTAVWWTVGILAILVIFFIIWVYLL